MSYNPPPYLYNATEQIDAAIFSGDDFFDAEACAYLRELMARWERGLKGFDKMRETPIP